MMMTSLMMWNDITSWDFPCDQTEGWYNWIWLIGTLDFSAQNNNMCTKKLKNYIVCALQYNFYIVCISAGQ